VSNGGIHQSGSSDYSMMQMIMETHEWDDHVLVVIIDMHEKKVGIGVRQMGDFIWEFR
jgi:hypothetical protein